MWPFGKRGEERSEQRAITEWPWDTGGPVPGGNVSVDKALTLVPVFGAARLLADTVASLTPVLYTRDKGGLQKQLPTPTLFSNPSVHGTIVDWLHRGTTSMALQGDAIGLITQRDYYNFPTMIEWLNPEQVQVLDGSLSGQGSFMNPTWLWNGRRLDPRNIIHIPWFTVPWKVRGLSPIGAFRVTANVGLGAQDYAAEWFQNGGVPPGTFRNSQQKVSKEDADVLTSRITKRLKTRQPLVYGSDWEYTPIAIKPNEAQFIETARLTATQIAVIYGIPPDKIGGSTGDALTYSTVEMNTLDYLTFSARPWLVKWEQALNRCFPRTQYVKFETSEMLRTDVKTRAEVDRISLGPTMPWKTQDEVRSKRDLPPMERTDPQSAWQIAKAQTQKQQPIPKAPEQGKAPKGTEHKTPDGDPDVSPPSAPLEKAVLKPTETREISGSSAVMYLRARVPQSSNPWPILKPPPVANGTKPLAVGRN
jgi:HK97 family phage portal protein